MRPRLSPKPADNAWYICFKKSKGVNFLVTVEREPCRAAGLPCVVAAAFLGYRVKPPRRSETSGSAGFKLVPTSYP